MFKIGDFSKLGQVSTRMLRHYDQLGLLAPNHVDRWTGYRYYTVDQLSRLHRIIALKELGLSLQQISELLQNDDDLSAEQLRGMLKLKHAEIEQELQENQSRLSNVATRLQQIEEQGQPSPYEIVIKSVSAQTIASIRQIVPHISEMAYFCKSLYQELYQGLKEYDIDPLQPEIAMYHTEEYSEVDLDVEMAVLVDSKYLNHAIIDEKVTFRELPARELMAALIYQGSFNGVSAAALALLAWVGTHQYAPTPPLRELRLSGPAHVKGEVQQEPVLELQLPIQKLSFEN